MLVKSFLNGDLYAGGELHGRLPGLDEHRHELESQAGVRRLPFVLRPNIRPVLQTNVGMSMYSTADLGRT